MAERSIRFDILSYWHAGSGRGETSLADAVVVKTPEGLPYLPGRTVKGLLRDAMDLATAAGAVEEGRVARWFGSPMIIGGDDDADERERQLEASRYGTSPGLLWFGSARLPEDWTRWARSGDDSVAPVLAELFHDVASTAIDRHGVALDRTLRVREVAVPMTLRAAVRGPDDDARWIEDLERAVPLLRHLGTRRHRGYGRVRVTLEAP